MSTEVKKEVKTEKIQIVEEISNKVKSSQLVVVSNYSGLSANDINALRKGLRQSGASAAIYKNTLTRRALDGLNISYPAELLQGPNIFITTDEDVVKVSKVLVDYAKGNESLTIKGGLMQESSVDEQSIIELAKLPGREVLIAKAVGLIKAPLTALVGNLSGPVRGFTGVLSAIKNKKDGGES